jgi:hypothetical protein
VKTTRERIDALIWKLAASGYGTEELNTRALPFSRSFAISPFSKSRPLSTGLPQVE